MTEHITGTGLTSREGVGVGKTDNKIHLFRRSYSYATKAGEPRAYGAACNSARSVLDSIPDADTPWCVKCERTMETRRMNDAAKAARDLAQISRARTYVEELRSTMRPEVIESLTRVIELAENTVGGVK